MLKAFEVVVNSAKGKAKVVSNFTKREFHTTTQHAILHAYIRNVQTQMGFYTTRDPEMRLGNERKDDSPLFL